MGQDLNRLMQALFYPAAEAVRETCWKPAVDVYRTRDGWLLKFDLAGVRPEDIHLDIQGSRLTVHGVRRDWNLEEGCSYYQLEIAYSRFERSIELPVTLDRARLSTELREGMLLVRIHKEAGQ